jgi:hypothetical protein
MLTNSQQTWKDQRDSVVGSSIGREIGETDEEEGREEVKHLTIFIRDVNWDMGIRRFGGLGLGFWG